MNHEARKSPRQPINCDAALWWRDKLGTSRFLQGRGLDLSDSGALVETSEAIDLGATLYVRAPEYGLHRSGNVRHCTAWGSAFRIGLELFDGKEQAQTSSADGAVNYYELLQINPKAEPETIHRVYRILQARYHPDNARTGDIERFLLLARAYETLSKPESRAAYDLQLQRSQGEPLEVFQLEEFIAGIEAESNRRLGILSLLYSRRRTHPNQPGYSLLEFESMMAIPREYLDFSVWYLLKKGYLSRGHNSNFEITVEGADFVESRLPENRILLKLLTPPGWRAANETQERVDTA